MAILDLPARRLVFAGAFAAAIALSPAIAVFAHPTPVKPVAACPSGESEDPYTYACVPELVPNGGGGAPTEQQLTQCSGRDQANCLEQDYYGSPGGDVPKPDTTVHQSP
ncbi:MAG: hypothetical protein QOH60_2323 [Mycobacterium sp.]|jgi:hypothetical protein|nr:hypothetical protein [Mycobacterium sp.]